MPTSMRAYALIAAQHSNKVDVDDDESVDLFFEEEITILPPSVRKKIFEELLSLEGLDDDGLERHLAGDSTKTKANARGTNEVIDVRDFKGVVQRLLDKPEILKDAHEVTDNNTSKDPIKD